MDHYNKICLILYFCSNFYQHWRYGMHGPIYDFQKAVVATVYERIGLFSYRNATFCSTMVVIKCTSNNYYLSKQYTVCTCIPVIQTSTALICLTGSSGFCVVSYQVHVTSVYGNLGITANVSDSIFNQRTQESCPSLLIWQMHVCKINY